MGRGIRTRLDADFCFRPLPPASSSKSLDLINCEPWIILISPLSRLDSAPQEMQRPAATAGRWQLGGVLLLALGAIASLEQPLELPQSFANQTGAG
jgi:hypothetical protein